MKYANRRFAYVFGLALIFFLSSVIASAQQTNILVTNKLSAPSVRQSSDEEDEDLIKPSRPGIANPAEFQKPGVLQSSLVMTEIFAPKSFARSKPRR